jgi:lipopolysaccharide export system protein LptA
MSRSAKIWLAATVLSAVASVAQAQPPAPAQQPAGPANALQGFAQNRDQPVKIDAASLEVRDKEKIATFSGNVKVVQGDTTMRSKTLAVFYDGGGNGEGNTANTLTAAQPGPGGQQQIRRLEAKGGVKVCQNDQIVTGDEGIFDMKANTVTVQGNVIMIKDVNVLKGQRLVVNLTTGEAKIEGGKDKDGKSDGVSMIFSPHSLEDAKKQADQKQKPPAAAPNKALPCT